MIVTAAQHETIHDILQQMLIGIDDNPGIIFLHEGHRELGISKAEGQFLREVMRSEGLITNADGPTKNHLSELTAKGYSIAQSPGGYRAQIQQQVNQKAQQQKQQQEELALNRQNAAATASGAKSAKVSAWVAALSLLVAIIATYIAYQATADSNEVSTRLQKLEILVQQLEHNQPTRKL